MQKGRRASLAPCTQRNIKMYFCLKIRQIYLEIRKKKALTLNSFAEKLCIKCFEQIFKINSIIILTIKFMDKLARTLATLAVRGSLRSPAVGGWGGKVTKEYNS